ncbi:transposase IS204/IS1001/IS1096/IS1165 family protein [Methylosinus sp. sav-2]|nr:transposase IS204/IS1001/IS1096/IS1165 family protein [Methylosinus sp. sav-2]
MTTIEARAIAATRTCPDCGSISRRVHRHYSRRLSDLPLAGRVVRISLTARRFRCMTPTCRRSIFTERFGDDIIAARARRTARLENVVHHLALALGGRSAAGRARRLMMPVSNDTLLRVVRRGGRPSSPPPTVIGIDDWAWKRNQRYGAIICDLGRRRPIKLLPDREPATAQAWLAGQPQIAIVARDRGGGFALAASRALPGALQVADRWHLMETPAPPSSAPCANRCAAYDPRSSLSKWTPRTASSGSTASETTAFLHSPTSASKLSSSSSKSTKT